MATDVSVPQSSSCIIMDFSPFLVLLRSLLAFEVINLHETWLFISALPALFKPPQPTSCRVFIPPVSLLCCISLNYIDAPAFSGQVRYCDTIPGLIVHVRHSLRAPLCLNTRLRAQTATAVLMRHTSNSKLSILEVCRSRAV